MEARCHDAGLTTRPGVSIHSGTQLQNYKELEVKWGYESEVHKIRTLADLWNRADRREGNALDHSELPFAFGSLCARLAVFHFRIKNNLNTDGRVHSPLAGSERFSDFVAISPGSVGGMHKAVGVHSCFSFHN